MKIWMSRNFKPQTVWDVLGGVLLVWSLVGWIIGAFPGIFLSESSIILITVLSLPLLLLMQLSSVMYPHAEGLGAVRLFTVFVIPIYIIILNTSTVLLSYFISKKLSFFLPIYTISLILLLFISNNVGSIWREQQGQQAVKVNNELAKNISVSIEYCQKLPPTQSAGLTMNNVKCKITMNDIPTSFSSNILSRSFMISLGLGSKEYNMYAPDELEREANIPGGNSEYVYNEENHLVWSSVIYGSEVELVSDTQITFEFNAGITKSSVSAESLYISQFTLEPSGYLRQPEKGKYFHSTAIELLLF